MSTADNKSQIMIVDDEENILLALSRELASTNSYRVKTFTSPELALLDAENNRYDLLLADYRMPRMHGLTFMEKFKDLQPHAATIIISGDADRAVSHSEFNEVEIPYLLRKPWQVEELLDMVALALAKAGKR